MKRLMLAATLVLALSASRALSDSPFALQISRFEDTISLSFPSDPGRYYILRTGPAPDATTDVVEMTLGNGVIQTLHDAGILAIRPDRGFYRLEQRYRSDPSYAGADADGDNISDVIELENPLFFDPLDATDASADFDNDGFSNKDELLKFRSNLAAPNAGFIPPRLATLSFQAAKATMDLNGLKVGKITFVEGPTDPDPETVEVPGTLVLSPVFVECCPAEKIPRGATLDLTVSLPPRSGAGFISQTNIADFDGNPENSAAYYQTIDPFNERTTLEDWKTANGFGQPGGEETMAAYFNEADLGFGRRMFMRREPGRIAYYVTNYKTANEAAQGPDTDIATVAMEYSPHPVTGGAPYVKFFTFNGYHPDIFQRAEPNAGPGGRLGAIDLDGRGPKFQPGMCMTCHGGTPRQLDALGAYPNFGRTGARFIPFDIASFTYPTLAGFSRNDQEAAFKKLNEGVLASIPATSFTFSGQVDIPEDNQGVEIPLEVSGMPSSIGDLDFSFDGFGACSTDPEDHNIGLNHSFVGDLVVTLTSPPPDSITVTLIDRMGAGANAGKNFCHTRLDDSAGTPLESAAAQLAPFSGSWLPENALSAFHGKTANGTWTLTVSDRAPFDDGSVNQWSLHITPADAVKELTEGWYGGPALPNDHFDEGFVPPGWLTQESLDAGGDAVYRDVFAKSCRSCHVMLTSRVPPLFDFDSYAEFNAFRTPIKERVFHNTHKPMPMAKRTFDKFWTSGDPDPSQAQILADWLDPPLRFSYTGPPVDIPVVFIGGQAANIPIEVPYQGLRFIEDLDISFDGVGPGSQTDGDLNNGVTHSAVGDLRFIIRSPASIEVEFLSRKGGDGNNIFHTRFDDQAEATMVGIGSAQAPYTGAWKPGSPLNAFNGLFAHGTWRLIIFNKSTSDLPPRYSGSLQQFTLHFKLSPDPFAPP